MKLYFQLVIFLRNHPNSQVIYNVINIEFLMVWSHGTNLCLRSMVMQTYGIFLTLLDVIAKGSTSLIFYQ